MKNSQPYKRLNVSVNHLPNVGHYVPPPTFDEAEIARLRNLPPGTLMIEKQHAGIYIAAKVLEGCCEFGGDESQSFGALTMGSALYNTFWYLNARAVRSVMRRDLPLPQNYARPMPTSRQDFIGEAGILLGAAIMTSEKLLESHRDKHASTPVFKARLGSLLGDVALLCASSAASDDINILQGVDGVDTFGIQDFTRRACLDLEEVSKSMYGIIDAHPSLAQLVDEKSPFFKLCQSNGGGVVRLALTEAAAASSSVVPK